MPHVLSYRLGWMQQDFIGWYRTADKEKPLDIQRF